MRLWWTKKSKTKPEDITMTVIVPPIPIGDLFPPGKYVWIVDSLSLTTSGLGKPWLDVGFGEGRPYVLLDRFKYTALWGYLGNESPAPKDYTWLLGKAFTVEVSLVKTAKSMPGYDTYNTAWIEMEDRSDGQKN